MQYSPCKLQCVAEVEGLNGRKYQRPCFVLFWLGVFQRYPSAPQSFCSLAQTLSVSPSVHDADESFTCGAHREQAQDLSPPPPSLAPVSNVLFPRWLSFSILSNISLVSLPLRTRAGFQPLAITSSVH